MMMMMMKEKSNKMQQCIRSFIIPYLYEAQHVSGDTPPIIRSLKLHWQSLVFHTQCSWQRPPTPCSTNFHKWKTRGCQCSFRLLMMGGVSPETCWASYKYGTIKFWYIVASCWIFFYELYYDAWNHEHQGPKMPEISWLAEELLGGQEVLCSLELVSYLTTGLAAQNM